MEDSKGHLKKVRKITGGALEFAKLETRVLLKNRCYGTLLDNVRPQLFPTLTFDGSYLSLLIVFLDEE